MSSSIFAILFWVPFFSQINGPGKKRMNWDIKAVKRPPQLQPRRINFFNYPIRLPVMLSFPSFAWAFRRNLTLCNFCCIQKFYIDSKKWILASKTIHTAINTPVITKSSKIICMFFPLFSFMASNLFIDFCRVDINVNPGFINVASVGTITPGSYFVFKLAIKDHYLRYWFI